MTKPTIICVDDEMLVLASLRNYLIQQFGNRYAIEIAESAEEALEILQELDLEHTDVPLVVSDQVMPGMKGDELLAQIHNQYPRTLKILLTGQATAEAVGRAVNDADLYRYIAKPWDDMALRDTVGQALHRYFQERDLQETNQILETVKAELEQAVAERSAALEYRLRLERLIAALSTRFVNQALADLDETIQGALRHLGEFMEADRCYLFQIGLEEYASPGARHRRCMSNTHEWCAPQVPSVRARVQTVVLDQFPWFVDRIENYEIINLTRVEEMPPEAQAELAEFTAQGIRSLLCVPIAIGGQLFGFVGMDSVQRTRVWTEDVISALRFIGDIIANALQRQRTARTLKQSEARHRAIVTALPDLAFRIDREGVYLDYVSSPNVINLVHPVECIGCNMFDLLPPEIAQRNLQVIQAALETGEIQTYEQHVDFNGVHHVEEIRVVACGSDEALFLIRDVTQRKEAERQLAAAKEAAESANQAKSIFLTTMSHELRTPLNAILGFAQIMSLDDNLTSEQLERIDTINRSGEYLLSLINDILDLARIEAGGISVEITTFELYPFLLDVKRLFQGRAEVKRLQLDLLYDSDLPARIRTDRRKLRQILINLLGNAIKFTPAGGRVWLRAELQVEGTQIAFVVEDMGVGIATEEMGKLFRPFSQTESGLSVGEGTGLGLVLCYQFAQLLGGEISVNSDPGWGSIFKCILPLQFLTSPELDLDPAPSATRVLTLAPGQPRHPILIIGSPLPDRLPTLLERTGFRVTVAPDPDQALTPLVSLQPELILAVVQDPQSRELHPQIQRYRAALGDRTIPIIGLTAGITETDRQDLRGRNYDDLLIEPIREPQLLSLIARYLDVDYLYTEAYPVTLPPEPESSATEVDLGGLRQLPETWRTQLREAILDLDVGAINAAVDQIRTSYPQLAQRLNRYAEDFEYSTILAALVLEN